MVEQALPLEPNARSLDLMRLGLTIGIIGLVAAVVVALLAIYVDPKVSSWVNGQGISAALRKRHTWQRALSEVMKTPGEWYYAGVVAVACLLLDKRKWRAGLFVALAMLSSVSNVVVKWIAGRQRPWRKGPDGIEQFFSDHLTFDFFRGGIPGFFSQQNLSFPSGHSCHAFAVATALILLYPRWGWLALAPALMTAAERVLTNSHYVSEVTGGGMLGAVGTIAVWAALRRWATRWHASAPQTISPETSPGT